MRVAPITDLPSCTSLLCPALLQDEHILSRKFADRWLLK
jgi:hypothetical protein